jgi:hypothetical protein
MEFSTREMKGEREYSVSAFSAGEYTTTLLMMVTESKPLLMCPSRIFGQGNKNNLPYYGIFITM